MKKIVLVHHRNRKAFDKVFTTAEFEGFETGLWYPNYLVDGKTWDSLKSTLPKSCTVYEVKDCTPE